MRVAVTGASGFVGHAVITELLSRQHDVHAVVRSLDKNAHVLARAIQTFSVGDIGPDTYWSDVVKGVDCVIHCAARAHVMEDEVADPLAEYRKVNVDGTLNLARQAALVGVKRFIFISSIKVNGEQTQLAKPFNTDDALAPQDDYGLSKAEAEIALQQVADATGMEVVIIRPPLVYGSGVKGNFVSMIRIVHKGIPLPLGAIQNQRSLVGIDNLVDLIITCIDHPAAANQTFVVSDDEDLSTTELLRRLGAALDKRVRLLPIPASSLELAARLVGKHDIARRLLGNLQIDISMTKETLNWEPQHSVDEGFQKTAQWYLNSR